MISKSSTLDSLQNVSWMLTGDTRRREVLNAEWFATTRQAQVVINTWLRQYNHIRPHHALGMRPPVPETILEKPQITGPD
jgi:putative transposase